MLSRQPLQDTQRKSNVEDRHVNFNKSHAIPVAMTINTVITDVKVDDEQNFVSGYRCLLKVSQSRTQSQRSPWSAGRRQVRLWGNGINIEYFDPLT